MSKIDRVILVKNAVETLGYFSEQIAQGLKEHEIDTYFVDYEALDETLAGVARFAKRGTTVLLTFNFIGLSGEDIFLDERGSYIWEKYEMQYVNILVDHPLYYHAKLLAAPPRMMVFCIDRGHVRYMQRFYSKIPVFFMPLAGNRPIGDSPAAYRTLPYEKRSQDLVFTGNYVPLDAIYARIKELDGEYRCFYEEILEDLLAHPLQPIDAVMERHVRAELGEVRDEELRGAFAGMVFIDICARSEYRARVIRELAKQDVKVHVFGADWEKMRCAKPWNVISNGRMVDSKACVYAVQNARLALNVMPWFKDGAHDRIFTAMLQGTPVLTDDSRYLREEFVNGENIVFFPLDDIKILPDMVQELLHDAHHMQEIARNGRSLATERHTWRKRVETILPILLS